MAKNKIRLQTKLLLSVSFIVILTIFSAVTFSFFFEKRHLQDFQIARFYFKTNRLAKDVKKHVENADSRNLKALLEKTLENDHEIIYLSIVDDKGLIISDASHYLKGNKQFNLITHKSEDPLNWDSSGLIVKDGLGYNVFISSLNQHILDKSLIKARKNDLLFDVQWEIQTSVETSQYLRIGFLAHEFQQSLKRHTIDLLVMGFAVLVVTLAMIYFVIRKSLIPLERFVLFVSDMQNTQERQNLRDQLDSIEWEEDDTHAVYEIENLKNAISKIKNFLDEDWEQIENHKNNLEKMVHARTMELNAANTMLKEQVKERKEIENRLVNAQKLESVGTLAGGIAHEFNNLFMAISGYAALIQRKSDPDHSNFEKAKKIRQLIKEGSESIKQLLGFARSGRYSPGKLNINELLRVNLIMFTHTRKDLRIITNYEDDLWSVFADKSQMEQIMVNLFLNASEAMMDNGTLIVETENVLLERKYIDMDKVVSGKFVKFIVKDNGEGMKRDVVKRVFDPFFTTKDLGSGTGLGLASVYGIVKNHGGFVTVESAPGMGSTFCVFLPAMVAEK